jgi:hypothetical protein
MTILFMDTETLGLHRKAPIWEFAAIRREPDGEEATFHFFIEHRPGKWLKQLPDQFKTDYLERYHRAVTHPSPSDPPVLDRARAIELIDQATAGAHIVGAVPSFDTERLARLMRGNWLTQLLRKGTEPSWHYHIIDIENVVVGYLSGYGTPAPPPWKSDQLSLAIGVDPEKYARHTAMGDCLWVKAQWDALMKTHERAT